MLSLIMSTNFVSADPALPLPRMPICGDQDDPADPIVLHCSDLIPYTDVQIYKVPDEEDTTLVFDFVYREATYNNELGLFKVDNADGTINGINPGEPNYLSAAFSNATIIFASGSNAYTPDKVIQFEKNEYIAFFIIRNSTLSNFLINNPENDISKLPLAFFSIDGLNPDGVDHFVGFQSITGINTQFGFEDMTYGGDKDYDDVVYNIIPPIEPACEEWLGEYFNNQDLSGNPVLTRCNKSIDFNWTDMSSPDINLIFTDYFSVRWTRTIELTDSGLYRFRAFTDDGLRLYIDGKLQIDDWNARWFDERSISIQLEKGLHSVQMDYVEWSGDALAYLNYYYCPEGEKDCGLNITPQYQTKYLNSPMPSDCTDEPNQTIARWGCAMTSVTMALQNYGINTTPDELNEWLTKKDGYSGGPCTANLDWAKILIFAEEFDPVNKIYLKWKTPDDVYETIQNGNPAILLASYTKDGKVNTHYVLAVDVINYNGVKSLGINDPHHAWSCTAIAADPALPPSSVLSCWTGPLKHAITRVEETKYFGSTTPLKYLEEDDSPRTASLQLSILGTEVMVVDSNLRHIGYSNFSNTIVNEFPNGMYYNSEIVPPGYEPTGIINRTLYLPEDASGNYLLRIVNNPLYALETKLETSEFTINFRGYDEYFNLTETNLSGFINETDILEYYIKFIPGQSIEIIPAEHIFLPVINK